ncbi:hypothetical protein MLD38_020528 [Melastoma candidum]|uniref:Uncharacterized protein n=1 Tax=Melastoma candidum TaxID=119954 RepID=A0ACB9QDC2_9MYRT|nr:hypothetical protein MLD38_020528 [Melastoma candidum]
MAVLRSFLISPSAAVVFVATMILAIHSPLSSAASNLPVDTGVTDNATLGLHPEPKSPEYGCKGSIVECSVFGDMEEEDDEMEFVMDSETNRRVLTTPWYISYDALWRNVVPCSRRGVSYYSCQSGAEANPYTRGCSQITRCRG